MIYLKDNKINKFNSNKIYLKDKLIYQTVKKPTIEIPTYLKSAFAYDSFAEDGIKDIITDLKYEWGYSDYNNFEFNINDHFTTISNNSNDSLETANTYEPFLAKFKSVLIKSDNLFTSVSQTFTYWQSINNTIGILCSKVLFLYNTEQFSVDSNLLNLVKYIYIDFNGGAEESKILLLDENFEILFTKKFTSIDLTSNPDNSNSYFDIGSILKNSHINFYYYCYCDKFLSIDEIKQVDKYMMSR